MGSVKFEPTLSLGHVLQAIVIVAAGIVFAIRLEARIEVQALRTDHIEGRVQRIEQRTADALGEIKTSIEDVKRTLAEPARQRRSDPPTGP